MSEIFSEKNMIEALKKYIPAGETLSAGIHAVAKETGVTQIFGKCIRTEDGLAPSENGGTVGVHKNKYGACDIYFGITQTSFIIADCERYGHYYEFVDGPEAGGEDVQEIVSFLSYADIGTCFSLADIRNCEIKKGMMGSVKCFITMKNGSYFKLMFPKLGGVGGGMPHHTQYREAILQEMMRRGN